jgi:acetylornithine deacetylase/succinyl-diaminopimelate desuccinylase-like protein
MTSEVMDSVFPLLNTAGRGAIAVIDMDTGAFDGRYTNAAGVPAYAISGVVYERDDIRAHGKDERVDRFLRGVDFYYRLLKEATME